MTIPILAWKEFARAFTRRAPGGRDFVWVAALLCLLQGLALIIYSAREGVLERSVDAFLGYQPGYGIPVWTRPNAVGFGGVTLISEGLVARIEGDGYEAEPFRRLFGPEVIAMPSPLVWPSRSGMGEEDTFVGLVADFDGPLYPAITLPQPASRYGALAEGLWTLVLDADQFRRHFDLAAYRTALAGRIPQASFDEIPVDAGQLVQMPMIWLNARTPRGPRLTPFRVVWGRYLGVGSDDYAYMVDRRLHVAMTAQQENPSLCIDATSGPAFPAAINRVQSAQTLMLTPDRRAALEAAFGAALGPVAAQFGGSVENTLLRLEWTADGASNRSNCPPAVPATTLALYLDGSGLSPAWDAEATAPEQVEAWSVPPVRGFAATGAGFSAPCELLSPDVLSKPETRREETADGCIAHVSATPEGRGYGDMLLFANARTGIDVLQRYINCTGAAPGDGPDALCRSAVTPQGERVVQSRLMLSEVYQDSLHRLAFLTRLFDTVSGPIGAALVLLLIAILQVQIGTVIGHRRHDYALMLANGFSPRQVTLMVAAQFALGVVVSMAAAVGLFLALKYALLAASAVLSRDFERIMLGRPVDVLPISIPGVAVIAGLVLALSVFFVWWQMRRNSVTYRRSLEDLLR